MSVVGGLALICAAAGLLRRSPWPGRLVGTAVSIGMIAVFALSRTVGPPGYREDDWEAPYGPLSLIVGCAADGTEVGVRR